MRCRNEGGKDEATALLAGGTIFYTGGEVVGKIVMSAAKTFNASNP